MQSTSRFFRDLVADPLLAPRLVQLVIGLIAYGAGIGLMVRAAVGVSPWDVLAQGVSRVTGLEFGLVTNLIGLTVLALWIPLRQKPGLGTVLNVLVLGTSAQLVLWVLPTTDELLVRIPLFAGGLAMVALATGAYIGAAFGPGPRDGLMTGLHARTGLPIWLVRTALELVVLTIGWVLGGNVGVGTLAFALLIGPMAHTTMRWFDLRPRMRAAQERRDAAAARSAAGPLPTDPIAVTS
jgi:uncharacterized membrane protein YczE